jgi:hypothetical protein
LENAEKCPFAPGNIAFHFSIATKLANAHWHYTAIAFTEFNPLTPNDLQKCRAVNP